MPQLFRQQGYFVARVGKLYHHAVPEQICTSGLDEMESWEYFVNPAGRDKAEASRISTLTPGSYGGTLSRLAAEGTELEQTDGLGDTAAISLLEEKRDKPFFLVVGFYRPDTPYVAPKKYFDLYPLDKIALPIRSAGDQSRTPEAGYASARKEQETMTDRQRCEAIQAYWASTTFMDAQAGRVLSAPGAKGNGKTSKALVELVDPYPTLADLCGLPAPKYLDGKSLKPVLEDPSATVKDAAFTQIRRGSDYNGYRIRTARWRYTLWDDGRRGEQLFDLEADPHRAQNLAADSRHASLVEGLKQRVLAYAQALP